VDGFSDVLSPEHLALAVDGELSAVRRLLPPFDHIEALRLRSGDVADWVYGSMAGRWQPSRERTVAVSKARHGIRPVAVWDLRSAVAYRAPSERLGAVLPVPVRSGAAWEEFKVAPLHKPGAYIVAADIAACYQMIDHGELGQELSVQTGDREAVDHTMALLRAVSGRTYGVPQQSGPSDVLAEVLLASLERRVIRKGIDILRYNDDFRINASGWSEVIRSIEVLSEEARHLGLLLNDAKVITYKRATYHRVLEDAKRLRAEIAQEAELDLTEIWLSYEGDVEVSEPEASDVEELSALRILERWNKVAGKGDVANSKRAEHVALVQLLPLALRVLSASANDTPGALDIAMRVLRFEQTITPNVCEFLLTRQDHAALIAAFDKLLREKAYLTGWQAWWLQRPLVRLEGLNKGTGVGRRRDWMLSNFTDARRGSLLRAVSSISLAHHGLVTAEDLLPVYDRASQIEQPIIVEAMGLLKPSTSLRKAVTEDNKLHAWIYEWSANRA
jgi:hypothetical protein